MNGTRFFLLIVVLMQAHYSSSDDSVALQAMKAQWTRFPENWKGVDPCASNWVGISCYNNKVVSISLGNLNVEGKFGEAISSLSELHILDVSFNPGLFGQIPPSIGRLKKLKILNLVGCGFSGQIPESIGSLEQLVKLSLSSNKFNGSIPASIGNLSELQLLDVSDNQIEGQLPVSPGLDLLLEARLFNFGKNKLSGQVPEKLFSSNMTLTSLLFDGNQFTGNIPDSLSLVKTLTVLRLDRNRLTGDIPSSLNNLTNLTGLYLANNRFTGCLPNLTSLTSLSTLDVSNNTLEFSPIPSWISSLLSLSTLRMESIQLEGPVPTSLFSPIHLQTVILRRNRINGSLDFGTRYSNHLEYVNLQDNDIREFKPAAKSHIQVILAENPVCLKVGNVPSYCSEVQQTSSYSAPDIECDPCEQGKEANPECRCAYPITGTLYFSSPAFSAVKDTSNYLLLQQSLTASLKSSSNPVETVAIRNVRVNQSDHQLMVDILIFPLGREAFTETIVALVTFAFSNQDYKPPPVFGSYFFRANTYPLLYDGRDMKSSNEDIIIVAVVIGSVVMILLIVAAVCVLRKMKKKKEATETPDQNQNMESPLFMGTRSFTLEELSSCTNGFSQENYIGGGGYGQVYKGVVASGETVAIKRAKPDSKQGALEMQTEIELLSRIHHRNILSLLGFCSEQSEKILVYEYIPNGSIRDSLSGKSGITLDWNARLRVALDVGKGLTYLHELADPPIIHRDIKSSNILLDGNLTAKIADFGLSKHVGAPDKSHVTTDAKGTFAYMDPEYCRTQLLTKKSDVYSFGVFMFELLTGNFPIDQHEHVVWDVKSKLDRTSNMYGLQDLLDTTITSSGDLKGFETYVDIALRCVDAKGVKRPIMSEVVREIENIFYLGHVDSAASTSGGA